MKILSHSLLILSMLVPAITTVMAGPYSQDYEGISNSSNVFKGWISGYAERVQPDPNSGGFATDNNAQDTSISNAIIGKPADFSMNGTTRHVFSLGNGGSITLTFDIPIHDLPGPDFAVFENGFADYSNFEGTSREGLTNYFTFAELAFVEVATVTSAWARFPVTYLGNEHLHNLPDIDNDRFASQDVTDIEGLAGKHTIEYGTPFDLRDLATHPSVTNGSVSLGDIRFIRLIDVIGDGSTTDTNGNPIYDPFYHFQLGYPNAADTYSTDGFDLRAIGIISSQPDTVIQSDTNGFVLTCQTTTNTWYQWQYCDNLASNIWHNLGDPIAGDFYEHSLEATNRTDLTRFYRLIYYPRGGE